MSRMTKRGNNHVCVALTTKFTELHFLFSLILFSWAADCDDWNEPLTSSISLMWDWNNEPISAPRTVSPLFSRTGETAEEGKWCFQLRKIRLLTADIKTKTWNLCRETKEVRVLPQEKQTFCCPANQHLWKPHYPLTELPYSETPVYLICRWIDKLTIWGLRWKEMNRSALLTGTFSSNLSVFVQKVWS